MHAYITPVLVSEAHQENNTAHWHANLILFWVCMDAFMHACMLRAGTEAAVPLAMNDLLVRQGQELHTQSVRVEQLVNEAKVVYVYLLMLYKKM